MKKASLLILFMSTIGYSQVHQSTFSTGIGTENGTYVTGQHGSVNSTYVGYRAGYLNVNKDFGGGNTFVGHQSGMNTTLGRNNVFLGTNSGVSNTNGSDNTFLGWGSGAVNTSGEYNTFLGRSTGDANTTASYATFVGALAGVKNTTGPGNTFVGFGSGYNNTNGGNNTLMGWGSGGSLNSWGNTILGSFSGVSTVGDGNTIIGYTAGRYATGSGNILLGAGAGENATGDNKLYIHNTNSNEPTIFGDLVTKKIGIGGLSTFPTTAGTIDVSNYKLFVKGGILTEEVRVSLQSTTWADYVFKEDYKLPTLVEVENHIKEKGHLINVPSAKEVKENGIEMGEMFRIQQEKIEELTLYIIEQNKKLESQEKRLIELEKNNK